MRCRHTTACGNDGKTKLISAGALIERDRYWLRNQIGELINRQLFGNDLRSQFLNRMN
jgi:hypothetical protein